MGIRKFDSREDGLSGHPNFKMPPPLFPHPVADAAPSAARDKELFMAGAMWGAECSAALLSPPKVPGEDVELACEDVARTFRGNLVGLMRSTLGL